MGNFQRLGAISNAHVGNDFEGVAQDFFAKQGIQLTRRFIIPIGVGEIKKPRCFDLGSQNPRVLVECKSHKWTESGNSPSAKLTVWTEAMYFFHLAPAEYRKIFFVLKHSWREKSLATHYLNNSNHLVPEGVEVWEYDADATDGVLIWPRSLK